VGAGIARPGKRVICLAGDGSSQLNIQELQTIVHHRLPIKIFVLNNDGYLSIRSTQLSFFPDNPVGAGPDSGVTIPDMVQIASAYGIPSFRIDGSNLDAGIEEALRVPGPVLCEVLLDPDQQFEPKLSSRQLPDGRIISPALEDLAPFLDRGELAANLLVPVADD
jgi:acetolactate synthase I/II/III large subunit